MKPSRLLLSALGCCALLAVTSSAQHQEYDKTTSPPPPAKGGVTAPADTRGTPRADQPSTVKGNDRLTTEATRFSALDTDGDNRISRSEFTLASNLQLQTGDAPGVAGETPAEGRQSPGRVAAGTTDSSFTSPRSSSSVELFNQIDTDKDGFLSRAELAMHHSNPQSKK